MKRILFAYCMGVSLLYGDFVRDNNLEVVYDTENLYMWQDNIEVKKNSLNWEEAKSYRYDLDFATFTDWVLPDGTQLTNLSETKINDHNNTVIKIPDKFENIYYSGYWTSNLSKDSDEDALKISFSSSIDRNITVGLSFINNNSSVRCIRNGSLEIFGNFNTYDSILNILDGNLSDEYNQSIVVKMLDYNTTSNIMKIQFDPSFVKVSGDLIGDINISEDETVYSENKTLMINGVIKTKEISNGYQLFLDRLNLIINEDEQEVGVADLNIESGWNLLALPVKYVDINITNFKKTSSISTLWLYQNNSWSYYKNGVSDNLEIIPKNSGFWINSKSLATISLVTASVVDINNTLEFNSGWNLSGIPIDRKNYPTEDVNIDEFKNNTDIDSVFVFRDNEWIYWRRLDNLGDLKYIKQSEGFWVKTNAETSLTFQTDEVNTDLPPQPTL